MNHQINDYYPILTQTEDGFLISFAASTGDLEPKSRKSLIRFAHGVLSGSPDHLIEINTPLSSVINNFFALHGITNQSGAVNFHHNDKPMIKKLKLQLNEMIGQLNNIEFSDFKLTESQIEDQGNEIENHAAK